MEIARFVYLVHLSLRAVPLRFIFRMAIREGDGKAASSCQGAQRVLYAATATGACGRSR